MADIQQFVFFDFEMLCSNRGMSYKDMEAIRIGAVKYDLDTGNISFFDRFIRPQNHAPLSAFCKGLTGISDADLIGASSFPIVLKEFLTWVGGIKRTRFFSWSPSDIQRLRIDGTRHQMSERMLNKIEQRYIDFQAIFTKRVARTNLSVENALCLYGLSFLGPVHHPMYDAYNTLRIYLSFHKQPVLSDFIMVQQFILTDEKVDPFTMQDRLQEQFKQDLHQYVHDLRDMYRLKDGKKLLKRTERFVSKYENVLLNRSGVFADTLAEAVRALVSYYHDILETYQEHAFYRSETMIVGDNLIMELKQLSQAI